MTNAQHEPFDFTDLIEDPPEPKTPAQAQPEADDDGAPPLVDPSEIELAREEGVTKGEQKALDSLAAAEAEALRSIATTMASHDFKFVDAIDREKAALRESAGAFLEQFCTGVLREREIELAETLLSQLLSSSEDRARATLFLNPKSVKRFEDRLEALFDKHGVGDSFDYEGDPALLPGECRLEWHGGAMRRTNAEIKKAMSDIFGAAGGRKRAPAQKPAKKAKSSEPKPKSSEPKQ